MVAKRTPRTFRSMWVGRTEESDEHLVVNEKGQVVRARAVRRCVANENSSSDVLKLSATPSSLKPDGDDVGVRERWTPTPGCKACESAQGNKHLVRCEARRYEYRLKYGRNPLVTTRRVYHEPEAVPEGTAQGERVTNPVSDREKEPASSYQSPSEPAQTETTHTPVKRLRLQGKRSQVQVGGGQQTQTQNRECSVTTHVPSQPMDLSDVSPQVRLNMKRSPLESPDDRSKQRRVATATAGEATTMKDPDEDEVMIGKVQVKEEVENQASEVSATEFDDWQQQEYEGGDGNPYFALLPLGSGFFLVLCRVWVSGTLWRRLQVG